MNQSYSPKATSTTWNFQIETGLNKLSNYHTQKYLKPDLILLA